MPAVHEQPFLVAGVRHSSRAAIHPCFLGKFKWTFFVALWPRSADAERGPRLYRTSGWKLTVWAPAGIIRVLSVDGISWYDNLPLSLAREPVNIRIKLG
jgi:hypothetical protein